MSGSDTGSSFWRGGEKIDLEKSDNVFTAIFKETKQLDQLRDNPHVYDVRKVEGNIYRLKVDPSQLEALMTECRSEEMGVVCHHAYQPKDTSSTRYYITDQIIAKFKPGTSDTDIEKILDEESLYLVKKLSGQSATYLLEVTAASKKNPIKVANSLGDRESVEYAEASLINRFESSYIPSDTHFEDQWHLKSNGGPGLSGDADVSATEAWDVTRGIRSVVVAVLDDGFDLAHPDFAGPGKVVFPKDYADDDTAPTPGSGDYHGTPCAGVAIAEENGEGVVGAAPGCAFMPVRFSIGGTNDAQMLEIFDFVGQHADVISCSWGPPPVFAPLSRSLKEKYQELAETGGPRRKGCVILFAAGNYNAPLDDSNPGGFKWKHPRFGLQTTRGRILNGEAAHPANMAISAITSLNRKSAYSNWGKEISVTAPSNNFHPLESGEHVPGRGIWTTDNHGVGSGFSRSRYTSRFGGTSSATPLAAGVAALVVSANPNLTATEVKKILEDTADKVEDTNPDIVLNNQKGTYDGQGHSEWFGYGRINAARAVNKARESLPTEEAPNPVLEANGSVSGSLADAGDAKHYKLVIAGDLSLSLKGADGQDFDLYVKKGSKPTTQEYDAVGYSPTANEEIKMESVTPGEYHVMVRSYSGGGDFQLEAKLK